MKLVKTKYISSYLMIKIEKYIHVTQNIKKEKTSEK